MNLLRLLLNISLLLSCHAYADTFITVTGDNIQGHRSATAKDHAGLSPKDFSLTGAGEEQDHLEACYSGEAKDVKDILKNIAEHTHHWKLEECKIYHASSSSSESVRGTFRNQNNHYEVSLLVHPCR